MSQNPTASPRGGGRQVGWTREQAELSISGLPEVRVLTNFDADRFSATDYVARLRRSAAAETAAARSRDASARGRDEEDRLDNPFVLTMSQLQAHNNTASSVDDERLREELAPRQGSRFAPGQEGGLEWDNDLFPQRIEEGESERFRSAPQSSNGNDSSSQHLAAAGNSLLKQEALEAQMRGESLKEKHSEDREQMPITSSKEPAKVKEARPTEAAAAVRSPPPVATPVARSQNAKIQDVQKCLQQVLRSGEEGDGEAWQRSCCRLHFLCETWTPARDLACGVSCLTHIVQFMKMHQNVAEVQASGCQVVMGLCRNHSHNHCELNRAAGLPVLVDAVRKHSAKNADVAFYGAQVLAVMSVPGRHDRQLEAHPEVVGLVVDCMRVHLLHEGVQSSGCWALANMCCNSGINQEEMKSFGVASVLHAINQWSGSSMVLREGCKALANMYHSETNRETLLRSGALEEVPLTLEKFPASPDVISTAMISIATFAATDGLRAQLCTQRLVSAIIERMKGLRSAVEVQEAGCWALANLVTGRTTPVLVQCGVVPTVCSVLYRQPFVETLQAMGCMLLYNIACSSMFRLDVVVAGAAELAVNAIRRMASNEKVVMAAVKLLTVLSHESPPRENTESADALEDTQLGRMSVMQSGGIEALVAAMQIYQDSVLHNMALLGLQHLSETLASHSTLSTELMMEVILKSCGVFRGEQSIVDKVLGIMENILVSANSVDIFIGCGGLHIVVSLMGQFKHIPLLLTRAAVIMARVASAGQENGQSYWKPSNSGTPAGSSTSPLCSTSDSKSLIVAKAGGIWMLKQTMDEWPMLAPVQAAACQALTCLASNETVADLLVKSECIRCVATAMLNCLEFEVVQERGASTLLALCTTAGFTANFYRSHGDSAVKAAHRRYPNCEAVVYLAEHVVAA